MEGTEDTEKKNEVPAMDATMGAGKTEDTEKKRKAPSMDGTTQAEETEDTEKKRKAPSMDGTTQAEETEDTEKKRKAPSMDGTTQAEAEETEDTEKKRKAPSMDGTTQAQETEDTEKKHKAPPMDGTTETQEADDTMETKKDNKGPAEKVENATSPSSSRLTGEQHRQQNKFVPDPRNPAEVRLRGLLQKYVCEVCWTKKCPGSSQKREEGQWAEEPVRRKKVCRVVWSFWDEIWWVTESPQAVTTVWTYSTFSTSW